MKNIKIGWKVSWLLALGLTAIILFMLNSANGQSVIENIRLLPFLTVWVFSAIINPFGTWIGTAFSSQNPNGPMLVFICSLLSLLVLFLVAMGIVDLFRSKKDTSNN